MSKGVVVVCTVSDCVVETVSDEAVLICAVSDCVVEVVSGKVVVCFVSECVDAIVSEEVVVICAVFDCVVVTTRSVRTCTSMVSRLVELEDKVAEGNEFVLIDVTLDHDDDVVEESVLVI